MSENDTQQKPKTNKLTKIVGIGMVFLILFGGVAYFWDYEEETGDELMRDKTLGERLDDNGWMVYTQTGCGACAKQQEIMGFDAYGLKIHDCGESKENFDVCMAQGIEYIPTWHNVFSNETKQGLLSLEQLEEMVR